MALTQAVKAASVRKAAAELGRVTKALEALNSLGWQRTQTRQGWERTTQATCNNECSGKSADCCGSESKVS